MEYRDFCMVVGCDNKIEHEGDPFCLYHDSSYAINPNTSEVITYEEWKDKYYEQ